MSAENSRPTLDVLEGGLLTTVQDLGRTGWQAQGVTPGGAADAWAMRVGNLLLGNAEGAAALETSLRGPQLRFPQATWVCLTGATVRAWPGWRPVRVAAGAVLDLRRIEAGARLYVCVAGGIDVPLVLGSRATHLGAGFGGWQGRALRAGDVLPLGVGPPAWDRATRRGWRLAESLVPRRVAVTRVRVLRGPQWAWFTPEARRTLLSHEWQVQGASDRMGVRLAGAAVARRQPGRELVSEPVAAGTVQVPPDGQPIVLLADRQTLGGYPKIVTVIGPDHTHLAQLRPGARLRFSLVSRAEAETAATTEKKTLATLRMGMSMTLRNA